MMKIITAYLGIFALLCGVLLLHSDTTALRAVDLTGARVLHDMIYQAARYPHWYAADDQLVLFWQTPSPGAKPEQTGKVFAVLPTGETVDTGKTMTSREPGLQPSVLHYALLANQMTESILPLRRIDGMLPLAEPSNVSAHYAVVGLAEGQLLFCYDSDLQHRLRNFHNALSIHRGRLAAGNIEILEDAVLPKPARWPYVEPIQEIMARDHLTYEQVIAKSGIPNPTEMNDDYSFPALAYDAGAGVIFGVGSSSVNEHASKNSIWRIISKDQGKTWSPQQLLSIKGHYPDIAFANGSWYVVVTEESDIRLPDELRFSVPRGYWPDEIGETGAWPYTGNIVLYRVDGNGKVIDGSKVTVVEDVYNIQASLAQRHDGLFVITYAKTNPKAVSTSLWMTTSKDAIHWQEPVELITSTKIMRDVDTVFFQGKLWITYIERDQIRRDHVMVLQHMVE